MSITQPNGVAQRIANLLEMEDTGGGPLGACSKEPRAMKGAMSAFELEVRDWGFVYGIAFALTRMEDPWESTESVAARALQVARSTFFPWAEGFSQPDRDALVSRVVSEYHKVNERLPRDLDDALVDLSNQCGA